MRHEITNNEGVTMIHIFEGNMFFAFDESEEYALFRQALIEKGIDTFIDLAIEDSNSCYLKFIDAY